MRPTSRLDGAFSEAHPPFLSVIVAAWNAAATIERAMDSVLVERGVELECIVVDDGSTDGTLEVLESIGRRDDRVRIVALAANGGVSNARNRGLEVARGTWLAFLDADDRMMPDGIAHLMEPTVDPTVRAVVGQRIWSDGERTWLSRLYDIPDIREPGRKSLTTHPGLLYYASVTGKAFHRSLADGLVFEGRVLGDQPWAIRALLRAGDDIVVIGDTVFEWSRPHPSSSTVTITSRSRSSAAHATEATVVARRALLEVGAEIDLQVADPTARAIVRLTYVERLVRSDLAHFLRTAIDVRDPDTGVLFDELGRFLEAVPSAALTGSAAAMRLLIRPPWERWFELDRAARRGYWRMLQGAQRADPTVAARLIGSRRLAPMLAAAARLDAISPTLGNAAVRATKSTARRLRSRRSR